MADPVVNVVLTLTDKLSGALKKSTSALEKSMQGVSDKLKKIGINLSAADLAKGIGMVAGAITAVGIAAMKTIDETVQYSLAMGDLSTALGTTVEETSTLVQIGDDLRISQGILTVAFRTLARQGIQPSVEHLKELAAQFQAIQDPAKRTQFAMENFGRSGMQMTRMLSLTAEQFDEMAASAQRAGLIIGDEEVARAKEYYALVDDLEDTWQGLKLRAGSLTLPVVIKVLTQVGEGAKTLQEQAALVNEVKGTIYEAGKLGLISTDEMIQYNMALETNNNLGRERVEVYRDWKNINDVLTVQIEYFTSQLLATKDAEGDYRMESAALAQANREMALTAGDAASSVGEIGEAAENAEGQLAELKVAMDGALGKSSEENAAKTDELKTTLKELEIQAQNIQNLGPVLPPDQALKLSEINGQIDQIKAKLAEESTAFQDNTKQILFSLLERELAVDGWTQGEIDALLKVAEQWGLIDEATMAAMKNVQGAVDAFNAGGSLDTMLADLQAIYDQIMKINGTTVQPGVGTIPNLGGGGGGGTGTGGGGDIGIGTPEHPGFQHGGSMIVPPGYPNDTYPLRVSSGETVTVTPAAHKGAPTVVNIYQTFNDEGAAALGMAMTRKLATGRLNNSMGR